MATAFQRRPDQRRYERGYNNNSNNNKRSNNGGWASGAPPHDSSGRRSYDNGNSLRKESYRNGSRYKDGDARNYSNHYPPHNKPTAAAAAATQPHKSEPMSLAEEKRLSRPPNSYDRERYDQLDYSDGSRKYIQEDRPNNYHSNKHQQPHHVIGLEEKRMLRDDTGRERDNSRFGNAGRRPPLRMEESERYAPHDDQSHHHHNRTVGRDDRTYQRNDFRGGTSSRYYEEDRRRDGMGRDRDRTNFRREQEYERSKEWRNDSNYQRKNYRRDDAGAYRPPRQQGSGDNRQFGGRFSQEDLPCSTPRVDQYKKERSLTRPSADMSGDLSEERPQPSFTPSVANGYREERSLSRPPANKPDELSLSRFKDPMPRGVAQTLSLSSVKVKETATAGPFARSVPSTRPAKRPFDEIDRGEEHSNKKWRASSQYLSLHAKQPEPAKYKTIDATTSAVRQEVASTTTKTTNATRPSSQSAQASKPVLKTEARHETKPVPSKPHEKSSNSVHSRKQPLPAPKSASGKVGIPMRWLKPAANTKTPSPPRKTPLPSQPNTKSLGQIPRKNRPSLDTNQGQSNLRIDSAKTNMPDTSKTKTKAVKRPTTPPNRLVTDASEGSSTLSNQMPPPIHKDKSKLHKVPEAIVTKTKKSLPADRTKKVANAVKSALPGSPAASPETKKIILKLKKPKPSSVSPVEDRFTEPKEDEWKSEEESEQESEVEMESDSESDSEMSEDETERWAEPLPPYKSYPTSEEDSSTPERKKFRIRLSLTKFKSSPSVSKDEGDIEELLLDEKERKKLEKRKQKEMMKQKASMERSQQRKDYDEEKARKEMEEERRKREEAKPLTAAEIRAILGEDDFADANQSNWVRRSSRKPSAALLNSKPVKNLIEKLRYNDPEMKVLKMKKFIADPNAPSEVLDAALNAMEENSICEALYIQNFNEGMRDKQVLHLIRILQQPSCKIWCLNIGENYNVGDDTWEKFTKGLVHTKITHMYASEHTITSEMKDEIRETIRENRKKHSMHNDPNNLDVIIQCTHCWWNPINAKVLRPYLKKKGYEHILNDKEAQGLQGSTSAAPTL